jgi:hypothetical protein
VSTLQEFVAGLLESEGAIVDQIEPEALDVLAPAPLRKILGWPELTRLGFGATLPEGALPVSLEGDWLDRFGGLMGERGRLAERMIPPESDHPPPAAPEKLFERTLDLPNAVWRLQGAKPAEARCLVNTFRWSAVADEKREGLIHIGFNPATGAVFEGELLAKLRGHLAVGEEWLDPTSGERSEAGPGLHPAALAERLEPALRILVQRQVEPFLSAVRRRVDRDRRRIHGYHDDLRRAAREKLAALDKGRNETSLNVRKREELRIATIEREYAAKLEDLRHNYALKVSAEWVQCVEIHSPVTRFEVLIKRRKAERTIAMDWHGAARQLEPPLCEWGSGLERQRMVCDDKLHITAPQAQEACAACGKAWCRACHPRACPRCGTVTEARAPEGPTAVHPAT